jgi:DNA-binding beta-propeller fold protein YncE
MESPMPSRLPAHWCFALVLATGAPASGQGLLVVSQGNEKILEYDASDGSFVRTFVEPITEGFLTPGGIAVRPGDGQLYVASTGTGEIWTYATATGVALPPPAATALIQPGAVAFDASGATLYFAAAETQLSTGTDAVLELDVGSGSVSTVDTDATANFAGIDVEGSDLYASDSLLGRIVRIPASGGNGTDVVTGLAIPRGVLLLSPTAMLVAESGTDRVLEFRLDAGSWVFFREVLAASAGVDAPTGLAIAPDERLTVSGAFSNNVVAVDLATLAVATLVPPGGGGLANAGNVAWSGSTLLVASLATNSVVYYDAAGTPTGTVAQGLSAPSDAGLTFTPGGNVIAGSQPDNDLVEYDGQGGAVVRKFFDACPTSLAFPFDVAVGPDGNIYVSCPSSDGIHRFDPAGFPLGFFVPGGSGGLVSPRGLVFAPNGNLLVASLLGEILEYDGTTGAFVRVFVDNTGNGGGPVDPYGLAIHQGSLFVASFFPSEVVEFNASTGAYVQTFVASGAGGLAGPTGLAFGPDGDLYVTSFHDDSVKRYDGANGSFVETFVATGSGGLDGPFDLAFRTSTSAPTLVPALPPAGRLALAGALAILGVLRAGRRPRGRRA